MNLLGRRYLRIDLEEEYLRLSQRRKIEIESSAIQQQFLRRIGGFSNKDLLSVLSEERTEK
jgi:hypothetical protein